MLRQPLDWPYILKASIAHGVSPLLYSALLHIDAANHVPTQVMQRLRDLYCGNAKRNQRLFRTIADIFNALADAGVSAIALKDLQLAWQVYPDLALRPIGDLDVLIRREDYCKTATCLNAMGFDPLPARDIPYTLKYAWAHHFRRNADNVWVDLQWNIQQLEWDSYGDGNFDFQIDRVWRNARQMSVHGCPIHVPKPEDMLFHLCMHLEGHRYSELVLFSDIAELLSHYEESLDWDYLVSISARYGVTSSVYYTLFITHALLSAPVPDKVLAKLEPACFKGNLFEPLFGSLTRLHLSLDEIRCATAAPPAAMQKMERATRRQAFAAMTAYRELDAILDTATKAGVRPLICTGMPSERVLPDDALPPFKPIQMFIDETHLSALTSSLQRTWYRVADGHFEKIVETRSADPCLAGESVAVTFRATICSRVDRLRSTSNSNGVKQVALRSLRSHLFRSRSSPLVLEIEIVAVTRAEMFAQLATCWAKQPRERLFEACNLLQVLRIPKPIKEDKFTHTTEECTDPSAVRRALAALSAFTPDANFPVASSNYDPIRLFEEARYSLNSWGRYSAFKQAFYYFFVALLHESRTDAVRYLLASAFRLRGPSLRSAMWAGLWGACRSLCPSRHSIEDFAYWIEPRAAQTEQLGHR
ncbi:MAG: nucleotidyltransferase family protein [Terriglobales bacterium]